MGSCGRTHTHTHAHAHAHARTPHHTNTTHAPYKHTHTNTNTNRQHIALITVNHVKYYGNLSHTFRRDSPKFCKLAYLVKSVYTGAHLYFKHFGVQHLWTGEFCKIHRCQPQSRFTATQFNPGVIRTVPDSRVHGANMGPIWDRQDPGGPHVGPMNFDIWGQWGMGDSLQLARITLLSLVGLNIGWDCLESHCTAGSRDR